MCSPAANEFVIVVENGAIVSVTNTVFGDTAGIGEAAVSEDALSAYTGATLESEVDAVSGSTFTSTFLPVEFNRFNRYFIVSCRFSFPFFSMPLTHFVF